MAKISGIYINQIGDINKFLRDLQNLPKNIDAGIEQALQKTAAKGEQIAVKHIKNQDLGWIALKKATIKRKQKLGHSNKTLIATSTYIQSITSVTIGNYCFVGIRREAKSKDGESLANIAMVHEYGSEKRGIKARKLWKPTSLELKAWVQQSGVFVKEIRKQIKR